MNTEELFFVSFFFVTVQSLQMGKVGLWTSVGKDYGYINMFVVAD